MAVKPGNYVLDIKSKTRYEGSGWDLKVIYPVYWENFLEQVNEKVTEKRKLDPRSDYMKLRTAVINEFLDKYNGEYINKTVPNKYHKEFVKFQSAAGMTFFKLEWD